MKKLGSFTSKPKQDRGFIAQAKEASAEANDASIGTKYGAGYDEAGAHKKAIEAHKHAAKLHEAAATAASLKGDSPRPHWDAIAKHEKAAAEHETAHMKAAGESARRTTENNVNTYRETEKSAAKKWAESKTGKGEGGGSYSHWKGGGK